MHSILSSFVQCVWSNNTQVFQSELSKRSADGNRQTRKCLLRNAPRSAFKNPSLFANNHAIGAIQVHIQYILSKLKFHRQIKMRDAARRCFSCCHKFSSPKWSHGITSEYCRSNALNERTKNWVHLIWYIRFFRHSVSLDWIRAGSGRRSIWLCRFRFL